MYRSMSSWENNAATNHSYGGGHHISTTTTTSTQKEEFSAHYLSPLTTTTRRRRRRGDEGGQVTRACHLIQFENLYILNHQITPALQTNSYNHTRPTYYTNSPHTTTPTAHHYHDHDHHHHQMVWVGDESRLPGSQKAKAEKQKQQNWWSSDHEK